ncbi:pyridoxal phosphate-dependent transferase [Thelonectria olida]|uniref:Pyridoxal phosphate-dependent transferase n=1 Tax=Thelonectria olida TaxID=1576542 RepID=A0A9P8WGV1_9HYPO|nr:pyridoxal phosphate-dependent transferase [Thelonectria olida]
MPTATTNTETIFSPTIKAQWKSSAAKASRDFRSDVVTVPTETMMQAILEASVNDDIYDNEGDPSVKALEAKLIALTGKDAALWALSGTQGNQICLRTHLTQPPHTVLLDYRAHVHCWESGALPVFSQASATTVHPKNGVHLTLDDVKANMIADGNIHFPPTRVVALENTLSGTILPLADAKAISEFVRSFPVPEGQKPIAMHLDAARVFDGVVGEGVDLKEYAACFDSMSICLAKGIGAPMGSIILGSKQFIERAKWYRKMFGGGTRQPGMMAAAAHAALDYSLPRLSQVHALTKETAIELEKLGYKFALPVQTNMIVLDLDAVDIPPAAFVEYCAEQRIAVFPNGRLVFHHQTSQEGADGLVAALRKLMEAKKSGAKLSTEEVHGGYS